jgi:hypothetical protein
MMLTSDVFKQAICLRRLKLRNACGSVRADVHYNGFRNRIVTPQNSQEIPQRLFGKRRPLHFRAFQT